MPYGKISMLLIGSAICISATYMTSMNTNIVEEDLVNNPLIQANGYNWYQTPNMNTYWGDLAHMEGVDLDTCLYVCSKNDSCKSVEF